MGLFDIFKKKEEKQEEEKKQETVTTTTTAVKRNAVAAPTAKTPTVSEKLEAKKRMEEALEKKIVEEAEAVVAKTAEEKEAELVALAKQVIRGDWGNGKERKDKLEAAGYDYATVQGKVNELLGIKPAEPKAEPAAEEKKSVEQVAREVIKGLWGNGGERKKRLEEAGYNYSEVQSKVNQILSKK